MEQVSVQADSARAESGAGESASSVRLNPKTLFVGVFLAGTTAALASSAAGSPYALGLGLPISAMLLYWFLGRRFGGLEGRSESFSDSTYYLGFLFTLVSLASALWSLRGGDPDLGALVSKFGLALSTTILGLFLRVYDVNFVHSVQEHRKHAERELARAMERFTDGLDVTSDKMDVLLHGMTANVEQSGRSMLTASDNAAAALETLAKRTEEHLSSILVQLEGSLTESIQIHQAASEAMVGDIRERLGGNMVEIGGQLADEIASLTKKSTRLSDLHEKLLGAFGKSVEQMVGQWSEQLSRLAKMPDVQTAIVAEVEALRSGLNEFSLEIDCVSKGMRKAAAAMGDAAALEGASRRLAETSGAVLGIAKQLESLSSLGESLDAERVRREVDAVIAAFAELSTGVSKETAAMERLTRQLNEDVTDGSKSLKRLQDGLVESAEIIIKNLATSS